MKTTITIAIILAALLAWVGPALDDHGIEYAVAADLEQAQKDAADSARLDLAARMVCGGENASYELMGHGVIRCVTKRGHVAKTTAVLP